MAISISAQIRIRLQINGTNMIDYRFIKRVSRVRRLDVTAASVSANYKSTNHSVINVLIVIQLLL